MLARFSFIRVFFFFFFFFLPSSLSLCLALVTVPLLLQHFYTGCCETAKPLRCSMNTCRDTSSVLSTSAPPPAASVFALSGLCVLDGFRRASKKRAWLPCWSQSTKRGCGCRSPM